MAGLVELGSTFAPLQPSIATLARLSKGLGINFHIEITPKSLSLSA
jgi:hypothetical protein